MTTKHFKITADASQTVTAAREVDRAFMRMARAAKAANGEMRKFAMITPILKGVERQAVKTSLALQMLSFQTEKNVAKMEAAFKNATFPPWFTRDHGPWASPGGGGRGGGIGGGGGGVDESHPRNRPLFGSAGRQLEQGQAVQNAIMAMLPLLVPAVLAVAGKYFAIEQNISAITLGNALKRSGVGSGAVGDFRREAYNLSNFSGGSRIDNEQLLGSVALAGVGDPKRAAAFANLARDIEAAGGSAKSFVSALEERGPEMAEALIGIAKELRINVKETSSVNETLRALKVGVGGLASEVNEAREGFPQLWQEIKTNLAMTGEWISSSNATKFASAALSGQFDEPTVRGGDPRDKPFSRADFIGNMALAPGNLSHSNALFRAGVDSKLMSTNSFAQTKHDLVSRLASDLQSGKITREQSKSRLNDMYSAIYSDNAAAFWDMAYDNYWDKSPAESAVKVQGKHGQVRPEADNKKKERSIVGPVDINIKLQNDTYSPNRLATAGIRGGR